MGVLDSVRNAYPKVADQVETLEKFVEDLIGSVQGGDFLKRYHAPDYVMKEIVADDTPPAGIYGVGATAVDAGGEVCPAVFVIPGLAGDPLAPVAIRDAPVAQLLGWLTELPGLVAVGLPKPTEHVGPGHGPNVIVGGELSWRERAGRCGLEVAAASQQKTVLTAGHFARACHTCVEAGGARVGEVAHTDYLARHQPADLVADVALVQLDSGVSVSSVRPVAGRGTGKQLDNIVSDGAHGTQKGWVRSLVRSFALRQDSGRWGEILITDRAISYPGDSGAPVYLDDDSRITIGHVVAGAVPAYSLVQDINYILHSIPGGVTLV